MVAFLGVASGFTPRFFITSKESAVASGFIPRFCGLRGVNQCDSWHKASHYERRISRSERVYPATFHYRQRINRSERVYPAIFHYRQKISRSERVYLAILWFASFSMELAMRATQVRGVVWGICLRTTAHHYSKFSNTAKLH